MEGKHTEGKQHRRRGRMGQLWLTVGWKEKRAKKSNEMTLLITALEGLRLGISSPKPAWSLETAYPNESGEEKRGEKTPNDNGTGQSWLAKLPQALSKEVQRWRVCWHLDLTLDSHLSAGFGITSEQSFLGSWTPVTSLEGLCCRACAC